MHVEPKCKHYGVCGGCRFQHLPYAMQLAQKEAFVKSCFSAAIQPILASNPLWHYRNKMEFSFAQAKNGEKFLGLMKKKGRVENLDECHLAQPWFTETLKNVRRWWQKSDIPAYYPPTNAGLLRTLILREGLRTGERMAMLTVSDEFFEENHLAGFMDAIGKIDSLILRRQVIQKKIPTRFEEVVLRGNNHIHEVLDDGFGSSYRFRIRGASFFQPNTFQAEKLYQKAIACAGLTGREVVLDLYCGTGSLGIFASRYAAKVFGIEIVSEAVQDARANLEANTILNMEVQAGDVGELLARLPFTGSTVFVDPPRAGLGPKAINHLNALSPKKIIYVSCNPSSQAADCRALTPYEVIYVQPVDQFPHTVHIENIVLLEKR